MNHMISCVVNEKKRMKKRSKKGVWIVMHAHSLVGMHAGRQRIRQERDSGHTGRQRDTVGGVI